MTESEWLCCRDNRSMLGFLHENPSERKSRLFACACYRAIWPALGKTTDRGKLIRRAVEIAEALADGSASPQKVQRFVSKAYGFRTYAMFNGHDDTNVAVSLVAEDIEMVVGNSYSYSLSLGSGIPEWGRAAQCVLIRDIFGNPFRELIVEPSWLTPDVIALATGMYAERAFDRMPILADALQDAGCSDEDIMTHLRGGGPHCRGCWALDLVLGKS